MRASHYLKWWLIVVTIFYRTFNTDYVIYIHYLI